MGDLDLKRLDALPTTAGILTRLACARVREAGIELKPLLRRAGLTDRQVEDDRARIKVRSQIRFLEIVADALQDDSLGFHIAQKFDLREIGLIYYVLASSDLLGEALRRAARFSRIANEGVSIKYQEGKTISIAFDYIGVARSIDKHQIECWMAMMTRICRELTGRRLLPNRVRFSHRREAGSAEFGAFYGCQVEFGAPVDEIEFLPDIKNMPLVDADPFLNNLLTANCEEALSKRPAHSGSFRSSVENAISRLLPHGRARADEIASGLGVSRRTFARRLSLEGTTFSEVLEKLRFDLAKRYLQDEDMSISKIAWLVGYQEVSAFSHAFKRWAGAAPGDVRSPEAAQHHSVFR
jgi:AraC-like DNA-binding protein